ncbi:MAG: SAM-dependent chlorinase/fluorinase, partial [Spirochaetaceae bacterium]|nr:SAM-dependent chlorinase/fluorinase [Spirochaetaceae bacterium]
MVKTNKVLAFQSDFGLLEGTVAQMYGVALGVDLNLKLLDITHNIEAFNTWDASYSLFQTCPVFPPGCVFVSVIDPGVGTARKSVVALTKSGHYIVTPDNGTLTHINKHVGITALREIDETVNRLKGSEKSHVFHGRDVYAYTGA